MTLQSDDPAEATPSPITITISATLDDYPGIPASIQTFDIQIFVKSTDTTQSQYISAVEPSSWVLNFLSEPVGQVQLEM